MSKFIPNDNKAFIAMIRNTNPQLKAAAPEMYELLKSLSYRTSGMEKHEVLRIRELLARIDGKEGS